jgi:hypothetical protein
VPVDLADPTAAALLASEAFDRAGIEHALYGGLLLAAYGEPRETRDADFAVVDSTAGAALEALRRAGLDAVLVFEGAPFGGLLLDRIALVGGGGNTGLNTVDLVRPLDGRYRAEAVARAVRAPLRRREVRVLTPEDFVVFKVLSSRDRDLDDAASVVRGLGAKLDLPRVRRIVSGLAGSSRPSGLAARLREVVARSRAGNRAGPRSPRKHRTR